MNLESVLRVEKLTKRFGEVIALNSVDFDLKRGEIHGIVGANGSGKSTFMNILFGGKNIKDSGGYKGKIVMEEREVEIVNTIDAVREGIGMVHQELSLLENLTISQNIKLNRENLLESTKRLGQLAIIDEKKNKKDSNEILEKIGINVDSSLKVKSLSSNLKQFVEIARELDNENLKLLILDEPTSSLNVEETSSFLAHLKDIAKRGISIIFISHRLEEVTEVCDRVTVLRDGSVVSVYERENYDIKQIAVDIVGKEVSQIKKLKKNASKSNKSPMLLFDKVNVKCGESLIKDISLEIKKGEVLGITGLSGHGQEIFGYGLMGLCELSGDVFLEGEKLKLDHKINKKGIYLLPEERKEIGLMLEKSVAENIVFESYEVRPEFLNHPKLKSFSRLKQSAIKKYTEKMVKNLNIKVNSIYQSVKELSGGNQQKVCIARAVTLSPKVLFVGEPTRGIDIYSKEIILEMLLNLNEEKGTTIVISSGEVQELKRICDRIVVMYENRVFEIFEDDFETDSFALAMAGKKG